MNNSFLSASPNARITAKKMDIQCLQCLPPLARGLEYYTFENRSVQPINERYVYIVMIDVKCEHCMHLYTHSTYRIAGNFRGYKFSRKDLEKRFLFAE